MFISVGKWCQLHVNVYFCGRVMPAKHQCLFLLESDAKRQYFCGKVALNANVYLCGKVVSVTLLCLFLWEHQCLFLLQSDAKRQCSFLWESGDKR